VPLVRRQDGQSTVEWIGLLLLLALVGLAGALAASATLPGGLAKLIAQRIACAAGLGEDCPALADAALVAEYGPELATAIRRWVPTLNYEPGMRALPVDFRTCREDPCSMGAGEGGVARTRTGQPVTLFVRVVDCRGGSAPEEERNCTAERAGRLFVQFWAYYPGSQSWRALPGDAGFHRDDWESFQVRVGPEGRASRASSHHGYNYDGGMGSWLSDAGIARRPGWGPDRGTWFIAGGSHAGRAFDPTAPRRRWTRGADVRLVPLETLARGRWAETRFAVIPPWRKRVYTDPEYTGTD
jgi:hypothetical protein